MGIVTELGLSSCWVNHPVCVRMKPVGTKGANVLKSTYAVLTRPRAGCTCGDAWGSWWKVKAYKAHSFLGLCSPEAREGCWPFIIACSEVCTVTG